MNNYNINITDTTSFFDIKSTNCDGFSNYQKKIFAFGEGDGEYSSLTVDVDINTGFILEINCAIKTDAIDTPYLIDYDEYSDLEEKPKASFITPKGAEEKVLEYIDDFTIYFSRNRMKIMLKDGDAYYRYNDGRMVIYYDKEYDLLDIVINDLTEEEYEALRKKKIEYSGYKTR